jgi:cytochrome c peroxidase
MIAVVGERRRSAAGFVLALSSICAPACGNGAAASSKGTDGGVELADGVGSSDGSDDPAAVFTADERTALTALALGSIPAPPPDLSNKYADDADAAVFGRRLFFDTLFSGQLLDADNDGSAHALGNQGDTGKVPCAGCHLPDSYYSDSRTLGGQISLGSGWGIRRAPSVLDVAHSTLIMWDGRRDALYSQIFGPIESPVEMNSSRLYAAEQIFAKYKTDYEAIFGALPPLDDATRFPQLTAKTTGCSHLDGNNLCSGAQHGTPGDGAEYDGIAAADQVAVTRTVVNAGKAIGAYERLLSCGTSRFDRWANGDDTALDRSEQRGAELFVGKGKCISCHSGPFLSDERFHNVGLQPATVAVVFLDANDEGAQKGLAEVIADPLNVKGQFSDGDDGRTPTSVGSGMEGAFRTPKLRCVSKRPSFMHTGQYRTLDDTVAFFSRGGDSGGYPGTNELSDIELSVQERSDVVAFLKALDGPGPATELLSAPP